MLMQPAALFLLHVRKRAGQAHSSDRVDVRHYQPIRHPGLEVLEHVTSLLGTEIAKASPAAVLNSTTYVPSSFGP
jgi:hypothetical protein